MQVDRNVLYNSSFSVKFNETDVSVVDCLTHRCLFDPLTIVQMNKALTLAIVVGLLLVVFEARATLHECCNCKHRCRHSWWSRRCRSHCRCKHGDGKELVCVKARSTYFIKAISTIEFSQRIGTNV